MKIYDVLLKNVTLIYPGNKINSKSDIAISSTKIAKVSKSIDESTARLTIDAKDLITVSYTHLTLPTIYSV